MQHFGIAAPEGLDRHILYRIPNLDTVQNGLPIFCGVSLTTKLTCNPLRRCQVERLVRLVYYSIGEFDRVVDTHSP